MAALLPLINTIVSRGAAANGGGTFVVDTPIPVDRAVHLVASVYLSSRAGGAHLADAAKIVAEYVLENQNGAIVTPAVIGTSKDPFNSADSVGFTTEVSDAGFVGAGGPTAVFTVNGANARLTVTNPGAVAADVVVVMTVETWGSA